MPIFVEAGISGRVPAYLSRRQAITMGDPPDFDDLATQLIALINERVMLKMSDAKK